MFFTHKSLKKKNIMTRLFKKYRPPRPETGRRPEILEVREKLFRRIIVPILALGLPAVAIGSYQAYEQGRWPFALVYWTVYLLMLVLTLLHRRLPFALTAFALVSSLYLISLAVLMRLGLSGVGIELQMGLCVVAGALLGRKAGVFSIALSTVTIACVATAMVTGILPVRVEGMLTSISPLAWMTALAVFTLITIAMVMIPRMFHSRLEESLSLLEENARKQQEYTERLKSEITARSEVEKELRESEEKHRVLLENAYEGIIVTQKGGVVFINDRALNYSGYSREELAMGEIAEFIHPDDRERAMERYLKVLGGEEVSGDYEYRILDKQRNIRWVKSHSVLIEWERKPAVLTFMNEITEMKRAEEERTRLQEQLVQAQKMEAIGTLAGGIAHDFNNILGAISGYTELLQMDAAPDTPTRARIDQLLKATARAKGLVDQILAFSREGEHEEKPIDMAMVVKEVLNLLRASIPTTIEIQRNIEANGAMVLADPTQIHQLIMNLCTNAAHAMEETGGILEVGLQVVSLNRGGPSALRKLPPGSYVMLWIRDNGHGMSQEIMDRIFDPYFTTKEKGVGTGLGLSVVHGIVKRHTGAITVESQLGEGTLFTVYFPRVHMESLEGEDTVDLPQGRGERILLVDDEVMIAEVEKEMLTRLGYRAFSVTSPLAALEAFREGPEQFDLVLTDQTMPGMTGEMLAREIMAIRTDMPVVLCTGYSHLITEEKAKASGIRRLIMKPLVIRDLAETVRSVLDREGKRRKTA